MPRPDWMPSEYDPFTVPDTGLEVVGRGSKARSTKTNIPDVEAATILQRVGNVSHDLADILRPLHAYHYKRTITTKNPDTGAITVTQEPEVLTYEELRERYDAIRMWEEGHQAQIEHLVSVKGFSVIRATGGNQDPPRNGQERQESSAGSGSEGKTRWK